jgi:uracil-DNA glycosylase family 4
MSMDFSPHKAGYQRDAEKVLSKLREPHVVRSRCVAEPWTPVDILFIGEAAGGDEDNPNTKRDGLVVGGQPFVGRSGTLLRKTVDEAILADHPNVRVGFSLLVRCRPPLNRNPNKTEIQCCGPELLREIAVRKPRVLVPTGNVSLEFLTGVTGITTVCGRPMQCTVPGMEKLQVVPCFHPAYVLRADHELDKFWEAVGRAGDVAAGDYQPLPGKGTYTVVDTVEGVCQLLQRFKSEWKRVAFDTETGSLKCQDDKFPKLLCFSLTNKEGEGYTIPYDHADSPWSLSIPVPALEQVPELEGKPRQPNPDVARRDRRWLAAQAAWEDWQRRDQAHRVRAWADANAAWQARRARAEKERPLVTKLLREFFADPEMLWVAQNEKFDRQHIRKALEVEIEGQVLDTMTTHLLLDERRGTHGLDKLAFQFTGMGGYDKPLEDYKKAHPETDPENAGGSYAHFPGSLLFPYAGADADVTLRALNAMHNMPEYVNSERFKALAEHFFPRISRTLADLEWNGAKVDLGVIRKMDTELSKHRDGLLRKIASVARVRSFVADTVAQMAREKGKAVVFDFNPGSDTQVGKVLWGYYGLRPLEMTDKGFETLAARFNRLKAADPDLAFSAVVDDAVKRKEWYFFSTKADVLEDYAGRGNDLAPLILDYRDVDKMLGTYIQPMYDRVDAESIVHGNFSLHSTMTGRTASFAPNLQNQPPAARVAYVSRFGDDGIILQADYSQIELRVAACLYNDPDMIAAYRAGADVHRQTAIKISGLNAETFSRLPKDQQKKWRVRAKRLNFGAAYGIGALGIQTTLKKDGVFITADEAQRLLDTFKKAHPRMFRNMGLLAEQVKKSGILSSFTGRMRRVPEVFASDEEMVARAVRQSINFGVQSGASDMTLMALILINEQLRREGFKSLVTLTVHDSIVFDCLRSEMLDAAVLAKQVMESIAELSDLILPGVDWAWLQVPIVAEFEAGISWGSAIEFCPFTVREGQRSKDALYWEEDGELMMRAPATIDEVFVLAEVKHSHKHAT